MLWLVESNVTVPPSGYNIAYNIASASTELSVEDCNQTFLVSTDRELRVVISASIEYRMLCQNILGIYRDFVTF